MTEKAHMNGVNESPGTHVGLKVFLVLARSAAGQDIAVKKRSHRRPPGLAGPLWHQCHG